MNVSMELVSIKNLSPSLRNGSGLTKRAAVYAPHSLRFPSSGGRASIVAPRLVSARGLGVGFCFPNPRRPSIVAFAASHEESDSSEVEVEKEIDEMETKVEESEEAWKQALASFKEQALKMRSVSQEAYEIYSKKALIVLKETSDDLHIQAEKARQDLSVIAKEISEESKEYLTAVAENTPEPVKEIVGTYASSTDGVDEISEMRDFHLGIPYGLLLSIGGFLSFMVTGSVSAIRFGVILGGALLALSVSSLNSYKGGETSTLSLKGQAAIASIISLREIRLLFQRPTFLKFLVTAVRRMTVPGLSEQAMTRITVLEGVSDSLLHLKDSCNQVIWMWLILSQPMSGTLLGDLGQSS